MRPVKLLLVLVLLVFLSSAMLPIHAQRPSALSADIPPYAVHGPYAVGKSWFMLDKGTDKPLSLAVWYPALKPGNGQTGAAPTVPDEFLFPHWETLAEMRGWGGAAPNAVPDTSGAPYPLVIFSPEYGWSPTDYISLEEHLASYGFFVLAGWGTDFYVWEHLLARPVLTHREIDFIETLSRQDGSFKGLIDTKHVGVAGHNAGGYTALVAAGAQFNFAWTATWCADHKDLTLSGYVPFCPELLNHKKDMLALAGLASMPEALWPSQRDPRVTAVIMQSGPAVVFGPAGVAPVTIPVMVQVGAHDTMSPPEGNAYLTYDNVSSAQKALVVFENGDNWVFDNAIVPARDLINHFTTAFLLDVLKSDKDAHKALLPDAVRFAGIQYKTTMK